MQERGLPPRLDGVTLSVFTRDIVEPRVELTRPPDLATVEEDLEDAAEHAARLEFARSCSSGSSSKIATASSQRPVIVSA